MSKLCTLDYGGKKVKELKYNRDGKEVERCFPNRFLVFSVYYISYIILSIIYHHATSLHISIILMLI